MIIIYLINAFLGGISVVIARMLNANLGSRITIIQSTLMNFVFGTLASIVLYIITSGFDFIKTPTVSIPIWAYMGGLLGAGTVFLSNYVTPKISALYLTLALFISQIFVGVIIDYYLLNEFSIGKTIGGLIVLGGLIYNQIIDVQEPKGATN